MPAFRKYRDFLAREYLPAARDAIAVSANPNGAACYDASVRYHSSVPMPAGEVHATGVREVQHLDAEMQAIGKRSFTFVDVPQRKVTNLVLVGKRAWNVTLDKAEARLYVVNGLSDDVTVVDVAAAKPIKSIPVGRVPYGLVVVE